MFCPPGCRKAYTKSTKLPPTEVLWILCTDFWVHVVDFARRTATFRRLCLWLNWPLADVVALAQEGQRLVHPFALIVEAAAHRRPHVMGAEAIAVTVFDPVQQPFGL